MLNVGPDNNQYNRNVREDAADKGIVGFVFVFFMGFAVSNEKTENTSVIPLKIFHKYNCPHTDEKVDSKFVDVLLCSLMATTFILLM